MAGQFPFASAYVDIGFRDSYSAHLRRVESQMANLARTVQNQWSGVGRTLAVALGVGGTGVGLASIAKQASDMETRMAKLARVTNLTGDGLKKLGDEFKMIATRTAGIHMEDVFGIGTFASKLGISSAKLGMFTRDVVAFSQVIDDMNPEDAATKIARLGSVFGTDATQARRYAAALVALDDASTATAKDILAITTRMAPMAKLLGMSPQRAMSLATTARETGVMPETAGTALAQVLGRMADPKTQGAFAKLAGMSRGAFGDLVKSNAGDALMKVAKGLSAMDASHGIAALTSLGIEGQRARQTMLSLAAATDREAMFTARANGEWETAAALQRKIGVMAGTTENQWKRVNNAWEDTTSTLGEAFLPVIKQFAEAFVNLMADVKASIEANKATFAEWGQRIANVVSYVGVAWRNFGDIVEYVSVLWAEKLLQLTEINHRFNTMVIDNMKWLGKTTLSILGGILKGAAPFLIDLGEQIGANLAYGMLRQFDVIPPALKKAMGFDLFKMVPKPGPVEPKWGLMGPLAPIGAAPGAAAMQGALPNLDKLKAAPLARLAGALDAQKAHWAGQGAAIRARDDAMRRPLPNIGGAFGQMARGLGGGGRLGRVQWARLKRAQQKAARLRGSPGHKRRQKALQKTQAGAGVLAGMVNNGGLFGAAIAGGRAVRNALSGVPGGRGMIKADQPDAGGDPQALLKKHDEEIGILKQMLAALNGVKKDGIPIMV